MRKFVSLFLSLLLILMIMPMGIFTASADTDECFTYHVDDGKATITDCDTSVIGEVTIPSTIGGYPVTSIGDYAFSDCSSLTSIDIPDSVTSIGGYAFYCCSSLTSINIPDGVTSIGYRAFGECSSLISIDIPDGVTSIGEYAFYNCSSLISIDIPDGVTSIGNAVFYNCSSLASITIPDSVTSIGYNAFSYCPLTSITIPDSVTSIGNDVFFGCWSLENVYITDVEKWCGIQFGDEYSSPMYCAENLYVNNQLLTDVKIPDNTEIINSYTFYNCNSIESVFIPKSMILIKQEAFYNCSGIKNVYFEGSAEEWAEVTVLSGNDYLKNATFYYNSTGIPGGVTSVEVSKLPDKVQYIENEEELDLTGGILTVNYEGGATQDIDLATLNAEGFDNSVLGKQTLTVKYGEFSAEFEVEVIVRPIFLMAVLNSPIKTEYVLGESLDLAGGKIAVVYPEGNYETFDITADMVSGFDGEKTGTQILTVTYKGYTDELIVWVFLNGDFNGDSNVNISDLAVMRNGFLDLDEALNNRWDVTGDGKVDSLDLVRLKKYVAGLEVELL